MDSGAPPLDCEVVVWHLWVSHAVRGRGCGKGLLNAVRRHVNAEEDAVRMSAEVLTDNKKALEFWRRQMGSTMTEEGEAGYALLSVAPWRAAVD